MRDLLPCPFCGDAPIVDCGFNYDYDRGDRYYVYSADVTCTCGCTLHVLNSWPKEYVAGENMLDFAIAAWNTRAERTCISTTDNNAWCFVCSECGKSFPRSQLRFAHNHGEINYCPNCGATVIGG